MLSYKRILSLLALTLSTAGDTTRACEDDHPPIVSTPATKHLLRDHAGSEVLTLVFDPRGLTAVMPTGDDANRWVDGNEPTGVWHYREWQWWKGHPFGESCRPRYWTQATISTHLDAAAVSIAYDIDGFECRQTFLLPDSVERDTAGWDLVTTIRNASNHNVDEYGQFFACYTKLNRGRSFWYWDESGELVLFSERGVSHLDGYVAHPDAYFLEGRAIPHCPRGGGKVVGRWHRPMMVSHPSPAGWRSIIMLEAAHAGALAQGIEGGAMDYILFPGPKLQTFRSGETFSAHIRHVMLKSAELPTIQQLQRLWDDFEQSHATMRQRAARL